MNKKRLILIAAIVILFIAIVLGVLQMTRTPDEETTLVSTETSVSPDETADTVILPEEEEQPVEDPYYYFTIAAGIYGDIKNQVEAGNRFGLRGRVNELIANFEHMEEYAVLTDLKEQATNFVFHSKVLEEAIDTRDIALIDAALDNLRSIDSLERTLIEDDLKELGAILEFTE